MPDSTKAQGIGTYANLCLTVIAGCLTYLCYRSTTMDSNPAKVEIVRTDAKPTEVVIVRIASGLNTPLPCKLMYKMPAEKYPPVWGQKRMQWTDEGSLPVQAGGEGKRQKRVQVEIVAVASNIRNPLPIKTQSERVSGLFGDISPKDEPIAVRLVGIEKPEYPRAPGKWDAIPARLTEIEKAAHAKWQGIPVVGDSHGHPVRVRVSP